MSEKWLYRLRDASAGLAAGGIIIATIAEGVESNAALSAATSTIAQYQMDRAENAELAGNAAAVIGIVGSVAAWLALAGSAVDSDSQKM